MLTKNTGVAKVQDGLDRHLRAQPAAARQSRGAAIVSLCLCVCVCADDDNDI